MADDTARMAHEQQVVVFALSNEKFATDINVVHEIIRMQTITQIPSAPRFVEGVINLRGHVVPVVDLRKRAGLDASDYTRSSRIMVVQMGLHTIGLVVDGVSEVMHIPSESIEPPSPVVSTLDSSYIEGVAKLDDELVIMLNLSKLLAGDQVLQMAA